MKTLAVTHKIPVRFKEVDSMGIVWHGHYLAYFEEGREAFGKKYGISYLDVKHQGYSVPIVKTSTDHLLPLRYGDILTIETAFNNSRAAKMVFTYLIKNDKDQIICKGETTQVFTAIINGELSISNPEFFKTWKLKHDLLDV